MKVHTASYNIDCQLMYHPISLAAFEGRLMSMAHGGPQFTSTVASDPAFAILWDVNLGLLHVYASL